MDSPQQRDSIENETQRQQEQQHTGGSVDGAANETNENMIESQSQGDQEALMTVASASTTVGRDELLDVEELLPSIEHILIQETQSRSIHNRESSTLPTVNMILDDSEEEGDQSQFEEFENYDSIEEIMAAQAFPSEGYGFGGSSQTYLRHTDELCSVKDVPEDDPEDAVHFNKDLPAEHSYLGSDKNRLTGVTYFEAGSEHTITLFMHRHLLFPEEILPFLTKRNILEACGDSQNGFIVGICFPALRDANGDDKLYGVTCRIFESGPYENNTYNDIYVKCCAMQRFVVKRSQITGQLRFIDPYPHVICKAIIKILPEHFLPEPAQGSHMGSMNRFRGNDTMQPWFRRYQAAGTPHPPHVYNAYTSNMSDLLERARGYLTKHQIDTMPADPIRLSFWLARNLHLPRHVMVQVFKLDSVNKRFKLMSVANDEDFIFVCRYCRNRIAECRHMFAMSKYGVQGLYCSNDGRIFEINTIAQVLPHSTVTSSYSNAEFSWFPGYSKQGLKCKTCFQYIGWRFNSLVENLVPRYFNAITTPSVIRVPRTIFNYGTETMNRTYDAPGPSST